MRTIDIFVSAPADVQKEHAITEQAIRSAAAEFNLPIKVWYSNQLRASGAESRTVESEESSGKSGPVLSPCFFAYPQSDENQVLEQFPNTGLYDLVICILWSRLGSTLPPQYVMPDGSSPRSATDYEVAWALEQSKRTPGCPGLHVFRNRATPAMPLEPKEQRENSCRQWDAVKEFYSAWEKNAGAAFRECCHDFHDLEEFENLFRERFRAFLARRLDPEIVSGKGSQKIRRLRSNPFRGLNLFDFEHSALYHGRTQALGEVLDVVKKQVAAKTPFLFVLGPTGSGKSSLVRAGLLPLVVRGATPAGAGPWRRAMTLPGLDPFAALASALIAKYALPELHEGVRSETTRELASQLTTDPNLVAARIRDVMTQLDRQALDHLLNNRTTEALPAKGYENVELAGRTSLLPAKPMTQLALVIDQLEELFVRFSPVLQKKYIAALCALAGCERVFIVAALRTDFYPHCQRFSELTAFGGRYDLQPPTPRGIGNMIRFSADAAHLRFERHPETGRSLDEAILKAAVASPEPLPLLEHLLSRLYERQLARKDGWLLWSDYQALGGFQHALAQHAEFVFLNLKSDEQQAFRFVTRNLVVPNRGEEGFLDRRCIPYAALISSSQLNQRQRAGTRGFIDRFIEEDLLSVEPDPQNERLIRIPQEAMLRRWPRLWQMLSEDRRFLQMRDRLDDNLKLWISRGRHREDLLDRGIGLAEAQALLTDFPGQLNEDQIDYIQLSLARHKPSRHVPQKIGLAAFAGLAISVAFLGGERFNAEGRRTGNEQDIRMRQQNADLADKQRSELEAERGALEIRLKETEQELGIAQGSAELASVLKTQLKKAEEDLQLAQQNADLANKERNALEVELAKEKEERAQLVQEKTTLEANQSSRDLETQLKSVEEKLLLAQQNADLANNQRSELEAELKKAQEEKAQLAEQNANLANSQIESQHGLETQLEEANEKVQLAQQNADLANSQRNELETQLKNKQAELQQVQAEANNTASQLREFKTQLKQEADSEQNKPANTGLSNSEATGVSPDTSTGSNTEVVFEEKQDNLPRGKYALLTPPHDAFPMPSPSPAKESETVNSLKPQPGQSAGTDDKTSVKQFILGYIRSMASDDTSLQRPYFGEQVNYYGEGVIGSPNIEAALERYHSEWPVRDWEPFGDAKVARLKNPNLFAVLQRFNWALSDGSKQSKGTATLYARVRKTSAGEFQIEYLRQLTADYTGRRREHRKRK